MNRNVLSFASLLGATLGALLIAGPVQASHDVAQQRLESLLTHSGAASSLSASIQAQLGASDGNPWANHAERVLIHSDTTGTFPAALAAQLQASDGSAIATSYTQRLLTHDSDMARTSTSDAGKTGNKVAAADVAALPVGLTWSDGGYLVQ
jgi:hypothetical protein